MPRPTTKAELLSISTDRYAELKAMVARLTPPQREAVFPFPHRDRNLRDVLAHLHEWHALMLTWYAEGMAGRKSEMPAKGYTWKTTPALNAMIWAKHQDTSLMQIEQKLESSHHAVLKLVAAHTDEELFTKRRYPWTGSTSLGSYLTSALSSHYDWALKLMRRLARTLG